MSPSRAFPLDLLLALFLILPVSYSLAPSPAAAAEKAPIPSSAQPALAACSFQTIVYDWDFAYGSQGFWTRLCDSGGVQTWEYGATSIIPGAPGNVWGTVLNGTYPNDSGSGLVSPSFTVTPSTSLVEVYHYFDVESGWDGCNLVIYPYGTVWDPIGGYTVTAISASSSYYAWCVDNEPGWTGSSGGWRVDCFDLSEFMNMSIAVEFDFGSDTSVTANGWYIARVRVGGTLPLGVCCDRTTGGCSITTENFCLEQGREWHGEWTSCDPNPCPQGPANDTCVGAYELSRCSYGTVYGDLSSAQNDYDPSVGSPPASCTGYAAAGRDIAYRLNLEAGDVVHLVYTTPTFDGSIYIVTDCFDVNDSCVIGEDDPEPETIDWAAPAAGAYYLIADAYGANTGGPFTLEWSITCPPPPGACCLSDGTCYVLTLAACNDAMGTYLGDGTSCTPNPCPTPTGACCFPENACVVLSAADCAYQGGDYMGDGVACDPNPCGPLDPPSNLLAETQGPSSILVSWVDRSLGEDWFVVERKDGPGGSWNTVQVLPGNQTAWVDPSVLEGVSYYYRVRAMRGEEVSILSNFAIAIAGVVPTAPTNVVATATSPVVIVITWVDTSFNEAGFEMQRKRGEFGYWENLHPDRPANAQQVQNPGVQSSSNYTYRIRSYNQYGKSPWAVSNLCFTPSATNDFQASIVVKRGTQPAPAVIVMIDRGSGFVYLGQTDSYGVYYATGLKLGDRLRAVDVAQSWYTCRGYRIWEPQMDMGMRLWIDSDTGDNMHNWTPFLIQNTSSPITLQLNHPYFRFDIGMSTEWDMTVNDSYWTKLYNACQEASDYLWDVSDGQMALRRVAVWDNKALWDEVDVQILNSAHPHADVDEFMDCDSWTSNEHVFMGRTVSGSEPPQLRWYTALIHELGHYILDLKDEYETGSGGQARMDYLKKTYPWKYPSNYGFMDGDDATTEMSSTNDYLTNYNYSCPMPWLCADLESEQLYTRGESCWNHVEKKLEGWSSLADIVLPPAGWFVNGASTSTDRTGPTSDIGLLTYYHENTLKAAKPQIEFFKGDTGPGAGRGNLVVRDAQAPVPDARVYLLSNGTMTYMGETDLRGSIDLFGLKPGDSILAYSRSNRGSLHAALGPVSPDQWSAGMEMRLKTAPVAVSRSGDGREDGVGPGACVDVVPSGSAAEPVLSFSLWPDEPLLSEPSVFCCYGSAVIPVDLTYLPGERRYAGAVPIAPDDPVFDGTGIFTVSVSDLAGNPSDFVAPFVMDVATPEDHFEIFRGSANLNIQAADTPVPQLASGTSSNALPFRVEGFTPIPVSDLFSFHLAQTDSYPSTAGLNVAYHDSLLVGVDETSLAIYGWDPGQLRWLPVEGSLVSTGENVVSAQVTSGGVYCVFAAAGSGDLIPPGAIEDFGAVGVRGQGTVELLWTATGDDGLDGVCEGYIVAYADSAFTEAEWELLPQVVLPGGSVPAGQAIREVIDLSEEESLYYLAIRAKDEASNLSAMSNLTYAISGYADPNLVSAPPGEVRAVDRPGDSGGAINLTWLLSTDDGGGKNTVDAYKILRTNPPSAIPESLAIVPAGTSSFVDGNVQNGRRYVYWVSSVDEQGETAGDENRAFAARNLGVPTGDFTSDAKVGVDDLGRLAETYGIDSSDLEFDPLFDLDQAGDIYTGDFTAFCGHFGEGGIPSTSTPGQNSSARVLYRFAPASTWGWHVDISAEGVSNLSGYSFRVNYPTPPLDLVGATPDSAGIVGNLLNREGGQTPLFVVVSSAPGAVWVANAIRRPSETMAPEGDGFLARVTFAGPSAAGVTISDVVLMDSDELLNYFPQATEVQDQAEHLAPFLFQSFPNPSNGTVTIAYRIPQPAKVSLAIYDVQGRLVRTLAEGIAQPGIHPVVWDGRSDSDHEVATGVYFYRFRTVGYEKTRKTILLR